MASVSLSLFELITRPLVCHIVAAKFVAVEPAHILMVALVPVHLVAIEVSIVAFEHKVVVAVEQDISALVEAKAPLSRHVLAVPPLV